MAANDAVNAGPGDAPEGAAPLGFELACPQGRVTLTLAGQPLLMDGDVVATIEQLDMEATGVTLEKLADPRALQNRRCVLRRLRLTSDLSHWQAHLSARNLEEFGLRGLRLAVADGELSIWARTRMGEHEADFTARACLVAEGQRDVRVTLHSLRTYGFLPVAAPLLARHLLAALGLDPAAAVVTRPAAPRELAPCDGLLPVLDHALFALLPARGWRLPDVSRVRVTAILVGSELALEWSDSAGELQVPASAVSSEAARTRLWDAELLLGAGESQRALDAYRRALQNDAADTPARHRILQLLIADPATLNEATAEAAEALSRSSDDVIAMLHGAVAAVQRGEHAAAAAVFEHVGDADEAAGRSLDAVCARFAAGRQRLAAGDEAAALVLLEKAVEHPGAAELLRERLIAGERWPDLVRVLHRTALRADARTAQHTHVEIGRIILDHIGDVERACAELDQAVRLDDGDAVAWEELGRARGAAGRTTAALDALERAIALVAAAGDRVRESELNMTAASISEAAGDDETALARLERAASLDAENATPLRRAAAIENRRRRAREAVDLLARALARTAPAPDRAAILREMAMSLAGQLGDFAAARLRISEALPLTPDAVDAIDELVEVAGRRGEVAEAESLMAWAADVTIDAERRRERLRGLRDASRSSGNTATLRLALDQLADAGGPEASAAALELGDMFLDGGDALAGELAQRLYDRLLTTGQQLPELPLLRLAQRLARISEQRGDDDAAARALRLVLDNGATGPEAADAWRRISELHARRGEVQLAARALIGLAEDQRTGERPASRAAALVAAADLLRRRPDEAEGAAGLYERALMLDAGCREALQALESLALEHDDAVTLAGVLERKATVVPREELLPVLLQLGELEAQRLKRPERAHDAYVRALEQDAASRPALLFLAREAWLRHDVARALELYQGLAAAEHDAPAPPIAERAETHLRLATLASELGRNDESEREVRQALELVPSSAPALDLLLGLLEAREARGELAEALARRADVEPAADRRAELLRRRAALLDDLGERGRAAEARRDLAAVRSSDPEVLLRVARAQHDEGHIDELERTLEQLRSACTHAGQELPDDALLLQANAAERQGRPADALALLVQLAARAQGAGADAQLRDLRHRAATLVAKARLDTPSARELLEKALQADPADTAVGDALSWVYAGIAEPQSRARAMSSLLTTATGLSISRRAWLHAAVGELAESASEFDRAEQAYRAACGLETDAPVRAGYMTAHARVLLARADVDGATAELEDALRVQPDHAGALAALADLSFRRQQWDASRDLYARLDALQNGPGAPSREAVAFRLGLLAQIVGDETESQRRFREVADLNPRHVEAREALAHIALMRRNHAVAAARLEELLRLIPFDDLDRLRDVRQRLGEVYRKLGDLALARHYLELVVAQDSARVPAYELLVDVYERQEDYQRAAETCGRLAQLYLNPAQRAQVLFRQGEILHRHLGRESAAMDAYLKSSDLDPTFLPTLERLSGYFWRQGDFENLAEIGEELCRGDRHLKNDDLDLPVRLAVANALALGEPEAATRALAGSERSPVRAARALAEAAEHLDGRPAHELEPAVSALFAWGGESFADDVGSELREAALRNPSGAGPLRALAWVHDRAGRNETARALYSLLAFVHRDQGGIGRLIEMGPPPAPRMEVLAAGGVTTHPTCSGPLADALRALAAPLEGFAWREPEPAPQDGDVREETASMLRNIADSLGAPSCAPVLRDVPGEDPLLLIEPSRPVRLVLNRAAEALPGGELLFLCARLLDLTRAGVTSLAQLEGQEAAAVLAGAASALSDAPPAVDHPMAHAAAGHLVGVGDLPRGDQAQTLAGTLRTAAANMPDWNRFLAGAQHTANRVGLLVCGNPLGAWRALARFEGWRGGDDESQLREELAGTSEAFMELLRFILAPEYEAAYGTQ